ncbi:MAG: FKBP-type peptidyl-prolyl cis-trans isomerase [Methylococcaceae bacterium]|nr:FKBP-type peptidyl-prolyl cis-trans isomerase [Methylococcaceae bacterium]MDD1610223.1 FKBP-type peptidyl-prolyl cis-trans isomerase [Methylococcaceae bacterium]MDD1615888.1 FKBP-type peptidyl-prolyl cis-trans isomerase [Methylococcaceae bacterium]
MRKIQTQILSIVTVMLIGLTMFSMANATTPEENSAASTAFLAENAKKANIVTTASGLQYEVLTKGKGTASPAATDTVTVHYKGTTLDGTEFDSSYSRGAPASFPLNRVIAGWTEGVQLMKEGDKFRFYIPADLAYGSEGAGRLIGPNAALIFEVELIKIQ